MDKAVEMRKLHAVANPNRVVPRGEEGRKDAIVETSLTIAKSKLTLMAFIADL